MSAREDYKWTDEVKNLKEGLPPNNKREPIPDESASSISTEEEKEQDVIGILEYAFKEGHFAGRQRPKDNFYKCLDNFKNSKLIKDIISAYKISKR